jgi:hypothetical protein
MSVAWIDGTTKAIRLPGERIIGWPTTTLPHGRLAWKRP